MTKVSVVTVLFVALAVLLNCTDAFAAASSDLPFVSPLDKLREAMQGPVAQSAAIIGIVVAGATLIFGGDLNGFFRSVLFLVMIVALIILADKFLKFSSGKSVSGAVVQEITVPSPAPSK